MARLHLIRHGKAAAGYGAERDPGLDDQGRAEAMAVADTLAQAGPLPILVSPLRRCRETAAPLEARWQVEATVEPGIAEVVAPTDDLTGRSEWLRRAMGQRWTELEPEPRTWHTRLLDVVGAIGSDAVLVTHFVAINAVIGAATGDDRVLIERLANGSITTIDHDGGVLTLVAAGMHGSSEVL
jgi:broad specificity phosphatase PhoE